jgi:negative regulator of sigma E activity
MRKLVVVMLVVAAVLAITVVAQAHDSEKKLLKKLNVAYAAEDWSTV